MDFILEGAEAFRHYVVKKAYYKGARARYDDVYKQECPYKAKRSKSAWEQGWEDMDYCMENGVGVGGISRMIKPGDEGR